VTDAAANLDITGLEDNGGRGDFLDDESADGITLSQIHDLVAGFESDLRGTAVGVGMPGGA
jgi:hypothetical protein